MVVYLLQSTFVFNDTLLRGMVQLMQENALFGIVKLWHDLQHKLWQKILAK